MDLHAETIGAVGGRWAKANGVGLDGVFQLALQLGYSSSAATRTARSAAPPSSGNSRPSCAWKPHFWVIAALLRVQPNSPVDRCRVLPRAADAVSTAAPSLPQSTYEACSTQSFRVGRTECIRSVTDASAAVCTLVAPLLREATAAAAANGGAGGAADAAAAAVVERLGPSEGARLAAMVHAALGAHRAVVRDCQKGLGHERHLRALLELARTRGAAEPPLFADGGWGTNCASMLSTSGLRTDALSLFGFGPVNPKGVGFGAPRARARALLPFAPRPTRATVSPRANTASFTHCDAPRAQPPGDTRAPPRARLPPSAPCGGLLLQDTCSSQRV
eukprot:4329804-Prymnesium_polylepis.1